MSSFFLATIIILIIVVSYFIFFLEKEETEEEREARIKEEQTIAREATFMAQLEDAGGDLYVFRQRKQEELDAALLAQASERYIVEILADISRIDDMIINYELEKNQEATEKEYTNTQNYVDYMKSNIDKLVDMETQAKTHHETMKRLNDQISVFEADASDSVATAMPYQTSATKTSEDINKVVVDSGAVILSLKTSLAEIILMGFSDLSADAQETLITGEQSRFRIMQTVAEAEKLYANIQRVYTGVFNRAEAKATAATMAEQTLNLTNYTPIINALFVRIDAFLKDTHPEDTISKAENLVNADELKKHIRDENMAAITDIEAEILTYKESLDPDIESSTAALMVKDRDSILAEMLKVHTNLTTKYPLLDVSEYTNKLLDYEKEIKKLGDRYDDAFTDIKEIETKFEGDSSASYGRKVAIGGTLTTIINTEFYIMPSRLMSNSNDYKNGINFELAQDGKYNEVGFTVSDETDVANTIGTIYKVERSESVTTGITTQLATKVVISVPILPGMSGPPATMLLKNLILYDAEGNSVTPTNFSLHNWTYGGLSIPKFLKDKDGTTLPKTTLEVKGTKINDTSFTNTSGEKFHIYRSKATFSIIMNIPAKEIIAVSLAYNTEDFSDNKHKTLSEIGETNILAFINFCMAGATISLFNADNQLIDYKSIVSNIAPITGGGGKLNGWTIRFPIRETTIEEEFANAYKSLGDKKLTFKVSSFRNCHGQYPYFGGLKSGSVVTSDKNINNSIPFYTITPGNGNRLKFSTYPQITVSDYHTILCRRIGKFQIESKLIVITKTYGHVLFSYLTQGSNTFASDLYKSNINYRLAANHTTNYNGRYYTRIVEYDITSDKDREAEGLRVYTVSLGQYTISTLPTNQQTATFVVLDQIGREMGRSMIFNPDYIPTYKINIASI